MDREWNVTDYEESADYPLIYNILRRALEQPKMPQDEKEPALAAELLDHAVASHDVTGITLTYLMYELSRNQELQHQLRLELNTSKNKPAACLTARELDSLPLLDAIVLETLRVHSANPGPWPRVTHTTGIRVGSYTDIPAGTTISASSWTLHQNAEVYPHPESWSPERWLDIDPETRSKMMKWFWPFGSGTRMCIGRHFAIYGKSLHLSRFKETSLDYTHDHTAGILTKRNIAIKEIVAATYAGFQTSLVEDGGMDHIDGVVSGPVAGKLLLKIVRSTQ